MQMLSSLKNTGDVEITPEMVSAGVTILRTSIHEELHHDFGEIVAKIFVVMQETWLTSERTYGPNKTGGFPDR